jgi:hypothetical protein
MKSSTLSVTFDTNVLINVLNPEQGQDIEFRETYLIIQQAIKERRIHGFFSDTWITLEGIEKKNRSRILGSRRLISKTESSNKSDNFPIVITINMGSQMERNRLNSKYQERKSAALSLGLRALSGQGRFCDNFLVEDNDGSFYANIPIDELIQCREKAGEVEISIAKRCLNTGINVGRCRAFELGCKYREREIERLKHELKKREEEITILTASKNQDEARKLRFQYSDKHHKLFEITKEIDRLSNKSFWYEGLKFAKEKEIKAIAEENEQKTVEKAVAEWADGENIVRHIGYGINVFCTNDKGISSGKSILDAEHRQWLSEQYGVVFCTASELVMKYLS